MSEIVECHSGFAYADRPVALTWEGQRLEIRRILAEWRTPEQNRFRVRTSDGREFELAYSHITDEWRVEQL
jgi:putative sterol carrier protein